MSLPSRRGSAEIRHLPGSSYRVDEAEMKRIPSTQANRASSSGIETSPLVQTDGAGEIDSEVQLNAFAGGVILGETHQGPHRVCCHKLIEELTKKILEELKSNDTGHWASLVEHTRTFDKARIDRWNGQIDSLLVYAALFSAIVAAFNIEFYKQLMQGPTTDESTAKLVEQTARTNVLLYAIATSNTSHLPTADPSQDSPPSNNASTNSSRATRLALAYNALWFSSLIFSLIAASLATLVKQWLLRYLEPDFDSSPREHLRLRQHRYNGLRNRWGVPFVIGLLPMMLRISFVLFLSGLVVELYILNLHLMIVVAVFGGVWVLLYGLTSIIPAIQPDCPYKSPESLFMYNIYMVISYFILRPLGVFESDVSKNRYKWKDWRDQELDATARANMTAELEVQALVAASVDLAISDQSLADVIEKCTQDLEPNMAMKLVHQIAHRRMYKSTPSIHKLDWKVLWDFSGDYADPERKKRYSKITAEGTKALLSIAIHSVTQSACDFETTIQALSCIATLLNYTPKDPMDRRLHEVIRASLMSIQVMEPKCSEKKIDEAVRAPLRPTQDAEPKSSDERRDEVVGTSLSSAQVVELKSSDEKGEGRTTFLGKIAGAIGTIRALVAGRGVEDVEGKPGATQDDGYSAVFTILYSRPDLCDLPRTLKKGDVPLTGILRWIIASSTTRRSDRNQPQAQDHLIYDQVFQFNHFEACTVCYIVLQLATQVQAGEIAKDFKIFVSEWTKMFKNSADLKLSFNTDFAGKCVGAVESMQKLEEWKDTRKELDDFLSSLKIPAEKLGVDSGA